MFVLAGCGGSVWNDGFQRAISIIPGIDVAEGLPAEAPVARWWKALAGIDVAEGLPAEDEALRPGYQPAGPADIVVAEQSPIAEPAEEPAAAPVMADAAAPAPVMAAMDAPVGEALLMGEAALDNSLLGRMQRVELGLLRLEADFQAMRPAIERLVAVEADLDELVDQLFLLVAQGPGVLAPAAPAPPVQQQAAGAPTPLVPVGDGGPPPLTPGPAPGIAAAPAVAAAAPVAPAPPAAMTGQFALHLASYRLHDNAIIGWNELMAAVPGQLSDLRPGTRIFNKGADGQFVRLKAGPLASEADAEARCRAIQAAGRYCAVMAYEGTTPLP
jgi:hypothetical protein